LAYRTKYHWQISGSPIRQDVQRSYMDMCGSEGRFRNSIAHFIQISRHEWEHQPERKSQSKQQFLLEWQRLSERNVPQTVLLQALYSTFLNGRQLRRTAAKRILIVQFFTNPHPLISRLERPK